LVAHAERGHDVGVGEREQVLVAHEERRRARRLLRVAKERVEDRTLVRSQRRDAAEEARREVQAREGARVVVLDFPQSQLEHLSEII